MRHWLLAATCLIFACKDQPSKLDSVVESHPPPSGSDPWGGSSTEPARGGAGGGGFGGMDLQGMLSKVSDSLDKPGPYEAPETSANFDEDAPHWGVLQLGGGVVERVAFSFTGGGGGTELHKVIDRLRQLASEPELTGLVLELDDLNVSISDVVELRAAMHELRAAGKRLACHTERADNATYLVLGACERIGLAPLGDIGITGPAAVPVHIKGLLDKLGVTADFLHVGAYKGAAEPLTRDAPSREMEETLGAILDRRYQTMVDTIAIDRKLDAARVKQLIDAGLFTADQAKQAGLVDEVAAFEAFRDQMAAGAWTKVELEPEGNDQVQTMFKIARFFGAMPPDRPTGKHVAVVYALGNIVDGDGEGVLGARQQIASHTMVAALRALTNDDSVAAVVLRIDSGGGSAQASELIWRAVTELKAKKPVVVSMSDVAASGGYYIASNATKIFALDDTLTGSIGVVGGKIAPGAALAKIGINTFPMGRGKRATMMSSLSPWRDDEKAVIMSSMEAVYRAFVGRVADGRHKKLEDVLPIAQGRVWTGTKAKQLGLVDEIGGLDAAIAEARTLGKVDSAVGLEVFPPTPTLRDVLSSFGQVQAPFGIGGSFEAVLAAALPAASVDPTLTDTARHLLELALSFRATTIQAVAVLPVIR
ncbi:MAG: signal peptide peptidase SppA [Kofleriaceae bacterium]